jgi:probable H4MPT-linked C1 transfer pathway protein
MTSYHRFLGIDIGGANLKVATAGGYANCLPFPLWKQPAELPAALARLVAEAPVVERLAATMTGELADCFATKAEGVRVIAAALEQLAGARPLSIYLTDGRVVSAGEAIERPLLAAASNWHAMASFADRWLPGGEGLLIDVGSTTTDLIPIQDGRPATRGRTDPERLAAHELVYTGVIRSPVCALVDALPWRGSECPVAQELFATSVDAWLLLGNFDEMPANHNTADGRPATRKHARDRLARMICADRTMFSQKDALAAAERIAKAQVTLIAKHLELLLKSLNFEPRAVVLCGQGEFLARAALDRLALPVRTVSAREKIGERLSDVGPAYALAVLAEERSHD